MREHFGFVDGISRPFIEGEGGSPLPGQGEPAKAGEFVLGYTNEMGMIATGPRSLDRGLIHALSTKVALERDMRL